MQAVKSSMTITIKYRHLHTNTYWYSDFLWLFACVVKR